MFSRDTINTECAYFKLMLLLQMQVDFARKAYTKRTSQQNTKCLASMMRRREI